MIKKWLGMVDGNTIFVGKIINSFSSDSGDNLYRIDAEDVEIYGEAYEWETVIEHRKLLCYDVETFDTRQEAQRGVLAFVMNFGVGK